MKNIEFDLLVASCAWPPCPQRDTAVLAAAARPIDWSHFLKVVRRHRVFGLVWYRLSRLGAVMPPDVARVLELEAAKTMRASLLHTAETLRLQRLFDQAGLPCAFLKGVTIAALAYGNLVIRHAKDIDIVLSEPDIPRAMALLKAAGYRRQRPPDTVSEAKFALWHRYSKDCEWRHSERGIELELHWRLSPTAFLLNEPVNFAGLQPVDLSSAGQAQTLAPADLFLYLCAHGASHGWNRLKWLADIQALLAKEPSERIVSYYRMAQSRGCSRPVGQALLLCAALFGLPLPAALAAELRGSLALRLLVRLSIWLMTRGNGTTEIYDLPFGETLMTLSPLLLATRPHQMAAELWHRSINPDDTLILPLPDRLGFLYRPLRGPLWLYRRMSSVGTWLHRRLSHAGMSPDR